MIKKYYAPASKLQPNETASSGFPNRRGNSIKKNIDVFDRQQPSCK